MDREKNPNQNNNQNICEDETEFVETHPLKFSKTI